MLEQTSRLKAESDFTIGFSPERINPVTRPPEALLADKAYDTDAVRQDLKQRGIKPRYPLKSSRTMPIRYSKRLCLHQAPAQPLKINRAIATR